MLVPQRGFQAIDGIKKSVSDPLQSSLAFVLTFGHGQIFYKCLYLLNILTSLF